MYLSPQKLDYKLLKDSDHLVSKKKFLLYVLMIPTNKVSYTFNNFLAFYITV